MTTEASFDHDFLRTEKMMIDEVLVLQSYYRNLTYSKKVIFSESSQTWRFDESFNLLLSDNHKVIS